MGAIPSGDMPGHQQFKQRVLFALDRCQETQDVDFKEAAPWEKLKWRITKTALAMGNLRDGGIVIIGVSQRRKRWKLTGVSNVVLRTYDPDVILGQINAYVSPFVVLDIVSVKHQKHFIAVYVREFSDTPLVCKKNGPNGSGLYEGAVYVRPPGFAQTTRIVHAAQMHDLLGLAAEKRARGILEVARRLGLEQVLPGANRFDQELGNL
jgi:hypothetical protein